MFHWEEGKAFADTVRKQRKRTNWWLRFPTTLFAKITTAKSLTQIPTTNCLKTISDIIPNSRKKQPRWTWSRKINLLIYTKISDNCFCFFFAVPCKYSKYFYALKIFSQSQNEMKLKHRKRLPWSTFVMKHFL